MILKSTIKEIVKSQMKDFQNKKDSIKRDLLTNIKIIDKFAIIISGIRRCGKSTLLSQLMNKTKDYYYLNFEDTRLTSFESSDFSKLNEVFIEEYGEKEYYFFDEIQNVKKWELFVRQMLEKNKKFVITGSNASLLSKELGTRLTGRHLRYELYPFSFTEMIKLTKKEQNLESFNYYLENGGFPDYLKIGNEQILRELYNDIVLRDIVARYKIRESKVLQELGIYLLSNIGKEISYNNLKKIFNIGSTNTIISFISFFEESYLLFTIPKFDYSLKKQLVNPKKIYSIDNGLTKSNSISFSKDKGRMLENLVFQELKRRNKKIYYFKEKGECDFLIKEKEKITQAIQVCYTITEENKKREVNGLIEALNKFKLTKGIILTHDYEDKINIEDKEIQFIPSYKWIINYTKK